MSFRIVLRRLWREGPRLHKIVQGRVRSPLQQSKEGEDCWGITGTEVRATKSMCGAGSPYEFLGIDHSTFLGRSLSGPTRRCTSRAGCTLPGSPSMASRLAATGTSKSGDSAPTGLLAPKKGGCTSSSLGIEFPNGSRTLCRSNGLGS